MHGDSQKGYNLNLTHDEKDILKDTLRYCCIRAQRGVSRFYISADDISDIFFKVKSETPISSEDFDIIFKCLKDRQESLIEAKSELEGFENEISYLSDCSQNVLNLQAALMIIRYNL